MRSIIVWSLGFVTAAAASAAEGPTDFPQRLTLVGEAGLGDLFERVAVKTDRPMPWRTFVQNRYRILKGRGDVSKGDLGRDANAAIWLAILDSEYRRNGRLLFVEGGKVPGVADDRWLSLREFENDVMPTVVHTPESFGGGDVERAVKDLVARASALHRLSWTGLLVVPGARVTGWRPLNPESYLYRHVGKLDEAYGKRDAAAMRRAAAALAYELERQWGYPSRAKLSLEVYFDKFAVLRVGFGLYVLSALSFFGWAAVGKRYVADVGAWLAFAGFIFMTAALAGRSVIAGHLPTAGIYEYVILLSWVTVLYFLIFYLKTGGAFLGVVVMPVAFLLVVVASLFPADVDAQLIPALRSRWLTIHVVLACLGEAAFTVAFAAAVLRLVTSGGAGARFLSPDRLELVEYRAITLGYPLFALGALVAGAVWAQKVWSVWWDWDPKETASLVVFLLATAYLHARQVQGWQGARAAVLAILVFAAAAFTLFVNLIYGGRHAFGL